MKFTQIFSSTISIILLFTATDIASDLARPLTGGLAQLSPFSNVAYARIGGGRSSGFRGSRGFAPRPVQPARPSTPNTSGQQPLSPQQPGLGGGGLMRGVMTGLAGGFLGSMLAQSLGFGGGLGMPGGGGGLGLFEILLIVGLGVFLFRRYSRPKLSQNLAGNSGYASGVQSSFDSATQALEASPTLGSGDPSFNLAAFKDQRMDDFLRIQSSWNTRDLAPVQNLIAPEFKSVLEGDISELKRAGRINKLENIAVRNSDLTESWVEGSNEYATINFKAQLLDYTIDENSQAVVEGDRNQPVKFQEEWTFVRSTHAEPSDQNAWKLSAISNQ